MKRYYKKGSFLLLSCFFVLFSCTKEFEQINKDTRFPDGKQKTLDGLGSVGLFPNFIAGIIPTSTVPTGTKAQNQYQVTSCMTGDIWSGYIGVGTQWDGGTSTPNFYIRDGRRSGVFSTMLENTMNPFMEIKAATHDVEIKDGLQIFKERDLASQANYSVAQIVKIMGMHRLTDLFGPIPYSKIGQGNLVAPYDSQQEVYKSMLAELQKAVETLNMYLAAGGSSILNDYDPIYQGETSRWIKLGNSLMLRLAMRVYYADKALCQEYVTKATTNSGGLMQDENDTAKLVSNGNFQFFHSMATFRTYKEANMGATIYSYMKGYNDARLEKYFTKRTINSKEDYYAVRMGTRSPISDYAGYSEVNIVESTPTYWFKASEVQFLLAEAALYGMITSGTAQSYYENGISLSFRENGLNAGNYAKTSGTPADYSDPKNSGYNATKPSTIDKKWNTTATLEENLERIITQKYIAIFPNGLEAWSEWRRTGYPRMLKEVVNLTNVNAKSISDNGMDGGIRREPFSIEEYRLNTENINHAKTLLNGADDASTNVWWDKKSK